jgi:hypothetical protein
MTIEFINRTGEPGRLDNIKKWGQSRILKIKLDK